LAALEEILTRRLKHLDWPLPEIIVVDGMRYNQTGANSTQASKLSIPLIGVVKNAQHKPDHLIGPERW